MMRTICIPCHPVSIVTGLMIVAAANVAAAQASATPPSQSPSPTDDPAGLVAQGEKLNAQGKQAAAMALYKRALQVDPHFSDAHLATGIALDLEGQYAEARTHLQEAIASAASDSVKARALRTMAISYAFTRQAGEAAKYEQQVIDADLAKQDWLGAADVDDELARIYLESGDLDNAYRWYQTGHETALKKTDLPAAQRDLWDFRWEHAEARIAARRGQHANAAQHVAAAKAIIDRGTNPDQVKFFPYLTGYVALYLGDYQQAITDLQKADQHDPFILGLIAQAYEKMGDKAHAMDYYRQVLTINTHNPPNAFARPLAKQKVTV
jgi:tetratricopeptide (TPR) repeat protein